MCDSAPEPTDIEWRNIQYNPKKKVYWGYLTNFAAVVAVGLTFGIVLLAKWGQV